MMPTHPKNKEYYRKWRYKNKIQLIELLGGKCCQCGFSDIRALQIDHIKGEGKKHLHPDKGKRGGHIYYDMLNEVKAGSDKYQLLCANCNWIKRYENKEKSLNRQWRKEEKV